MEIAVILLANDSILIAFAHLCGGEFLPRQAQNMFFRSRVSTGRSHISSKRSLKTGDLGAVSIRYGERHSMVQEAKHDTRYGKSHCHSKLPLYQTLHASVQQA